MSQFSAPPADPYADPYAEPPKTSGLAVTSLVCSLILCCPLTTLLGPVLGLAALVSIGSNPARKGKGLAITGILLGLVFTAIWAWVIMWGIDIGKQSWDLMMVRAPEAVMAGASGDAAAFKSEFHGDGAAASDADVKAFFDELEGRYGQLQSVTFSQAAQASPQPGQPAVPMPYVFVFANGTMDGEIELLFADPINPTGFLFKLGYVQVFDSEQGDVTFPPDS